MTRNDSIEALVLRLQGTPYGHDDLATAFVTDEDDCGVDAESSWLCEALTRYRELVCAAASLPAPGDERARLVSRLRSFLAPMASEDLDTYWPTLLALVDVTLACAAVGRVLPPLARRTWDAVLAGTYAFGFDEEALLTSSTDVLFRDGICLDRDLHWRGPLTPLLGRTVEHAEVIAVEMDDGHDEGLSLALDDASVVQLLIGDDGGIELAVWDYPQGPPSDAPAPLRELALAGAVIRSAEVQSEGDFGFADLALSFADGRRLCLRLADPERLGTAEVSLGPG